MNTKRSELRLECLKLALANCREYPEAMERAKKFEEYILAAESEPEENVQSHKKLKTFSTK